MASNVPPLSLKLWTTLSAEKRNKYGSFLFSEPSSTILIAIQSITLIAFILSCYSFVLYVIHSVCLAIFLLVSQSDSLSLLY